MKTFDEAAQIVFGIVPQEEDLSDAQIEKLRNTQTGFGSDIQNSIYLPILREAAHALGMTVAADQEDVCELIPSVFLHALTYGVAIGVLMEKREE